VVGVGGYADGHRLILVRCGQIPGSRGGRGTSVNVDRWWEHFEVAFASIAGRFERVEPRRRARSFLLGLLSDVDTRSCWQVAEQVGDASPHAMQRLLGEAVWDADKVRDDLRDYVIDHLGEPDGVLILDDTGDLKKGTHTVGGTTPVHQHRRQDRERAGGGRRTNRGSGRRRLTTTQRRSRRACPALTPLMAPTTSYRRPVMTRELGRRSRQLQHASHGGGADTHTAAVSQVSVPNKR